MTSGGEVSDVRQVVSPVLVNDKNTRLYHIDFSFDEQRLGGSAFAQSLGKIGSDVPTVKEPQYFCDCFDAVQEMIRRGWILAGHDISAGGLITTLLEMTFANAEGGLHINLHDIKGDDVIKKLFAENPGVVIQVADEHKEEVKEFLTENCIGLLVSVHQVLISARSASLMAIGRQSSILMQCVKHGIRLRTCSTASRV